MKKIICVLALLLALMCVMAIPAAASSAYQTYTYSINGDPLYSPDAYSAYQTLAAPDMGLDELGLNNPADLVTDELENVYIADAGNNRIIILNRYYRDPKYISTFINAQGIDDGLSNPQGIFVTEENIWVCDTGKARIVVFDREGNFIREFEQPQSALFDDNAVYRPVAMAVDDVGKMYVVSSTTYQGIIVLSPDGEFIRFIGAQAVTISAWEIIWRRFQTDEQRKLTQSYVATEFNNITYTKGDDQGNGYLYVTTSSIDPGTAAAQIKSGNKNGDFMPVKMLNSAGKEIMRRNGFWPPVGEVDILGGFNKDVSSSGVSRIIDVACGPEKTWSIIDEKRSKIYTYDFNGNLLFAFGDKGTMLGAVANIEAITYQGDTMLVLDKSNNCMVVYERTEYGDLLLEAISAENSLDYTYAIQCWRSVLQHNSNFDAAYVGIGNALYRSGEYEASLEYYETAYDTANWSNSYREVRKEWMADFFLLLVFIIIAAIVLVVKFFGYAKKVNKKAATDGRERKTFWQELMYGFYTIFHPFDGFWDLKHEKRGSLRAALVYVALTIVAFFYQSIGQGYVFNPTGKYSTIWAQALGVLVPMLLFVIANWCLTTLFEGEGSFKDIFIAVSYCLTPVPMLVIPATFLSNFVTDSEAGLVSLVTTIAFVWMGFMVFFATMVTHDYSMGRNILTFVGTIVGMALIMFVAVLFTTLVGKIVSLITNIVTELQYRV
jgi:hypothetical protein